VDLLKIRRHGPYLKEHHPAIRTVDLGVSHVNSSLPQLVKYLRERRPRAILTDKDRVNRISILAGLITRSQTRVVVRIGTTVTENLRKRPFLDKYTQLLSMRMLYPRAHAVLVPSAGARDDLVAISPKLRGKVKVVSSPIIDKGFHERAAQPPDHPWLRDGGPPVIVGVGELCERKDFSTLIRGFGEASRKREMRLIILGEGRKRRKLEQLATDLGLAQRVDLPGFKPNPLPYMSRAACFCLTSRCEGLPVALIEAMATGTPVVSTDCPSGPREVLSGNRAGILVNVGDHLALGKAILKTLEHPPSPEEVKGAVARFTVENGTAEYLEELLA